MTSSVIRKTKRGKSIRFLCKACSKYFSVSTHWIDTKQILNDHLDGFSFRTLSRKYEISPMKAWRICHSELKKLPPNNEFTFKYCNRFSQILVCDGKYFNVSSSQSDYVLLWGFDYFRHDIPVFTIAPSESYQAWSRFFSYFRIINSYPRLLVCDDNSNIKMAARTKFPQVKIQTCYNHFKENIRRNLKVRSEDTYKSFMMRIEDIFSHKRTDIDLNKKLFALYRDYQSDPVCLSTITNIQRFMPELLAYRNIKGSPLTTNLIEGLNSHLEARLTSLRSFQTIQHAKLWMNGYILKRRFTKWTDCTGKFKKLNGKRAVDLTKKYDIVLPTYF